MSGFFFTYSMILLYHILCNIHTSYKMESNAHVRQPSFSANNVTVRFTWMFSWKMKIGVKGARAVHVSKIRDTALVISVTSTGSDRNKIYMRD